MTEYTGTVSNVVFDDHWVDLTETGTFTCVLSKSASASDLSLVIDIYDLDNQVHPDGHLGWWQFPVSQLGKRVVGHLSLTDTGVLCELDGFQPGHQWVNKENIRFRRLVVNAVLRSNITNGIVYLDKVPAFKYASDWASFRQNFSRDWKCPAYAPASFVVPPGEVVRIVSRNIFLKDAVGNFCLELYRVLKQNNIPVELYAEQFDLSLNDIVRRVDLIFKEAKLQDQLLYFSSTHDPALDRLLTLPFSRRIAYFHGITPPELLQVFDPELSMVCRRAYGQLGRLKEFDVVATNSRSSKEFLISFFGDDGDISAKDIKVIPPRLLAPEVFESASQPVARTLETRSETRLLYVGRIKSHKKIEDLLQLLAAYRKYDPRVVLWIVGGGYDKAYRDYLRWVQEQDLKLQPDSVTWFGSIDDAKLSELYQTGSAYVNMSEHEGFCVPVFEAMLAGLPVFTFGLPAIREVLDNSGVYFVEKNYEHLARSIKSVLDDPSRREAIIAKQKIRAAQLANAMDGKAMLELLEPKLPVEATESG